MSDILIGFTVLVENIAREQQGLAEKLRSLMRSAGEEVAYGNLVEFLLFHFSKTGMKCYESVKAIDYRRITVDMPPHAVLDQVKSAKQQCRDDDNVAHGFLLNLALEYLEERGYLTSREKLSDILTSLKSIDPAMLVAVEAGLSELLARAKRVVETLVEREEQQ